MQGDAAGWPNEVYCELYHELNGPSEMVKQDHLKYFRFHGRDLPGQLFDLDADPEENRNLIDAPACAADLQRLHTRLDAFGLNALHPPATSARAVRSSRRYGRVRGMSESEPTLRDVLGAVNELRGEVGEVRISLGDVRGRLGRVDGRLDGLSDEVAEQGRRLDRVDGRLDGLTGEVGEVRIGLGDVRGRLDRVDGRLDGLTGEVETLGRETRELHTELPSRVVAGVLVGFERSAFATDLRTPQAEVAELKADVAELRRASSE